MALPRARIIKGTENVAAAAQPLALKKTTAPSQIPLKRRNILGDIKNNPSAQDEIVKKTEKLTLAAKNKATQPTYVTTAGVAAVKKCAVLKEDPKKNVKKPSNGLKPDRATRAFSALLLPSDVFDIDADDKENPTLYADYVNDVYLHLWELETKFPIRAHHMSNQVEVTPRMRGILIDWLVQVHTKFLLLPETLYLCINILDRFLQERVINRTKLQLVGITSLFTASKYEEVIPPEVKDYVHITDNAYTKEEVLKMEQLILRTLKFHLSVPCTLHFLRRNSKAAKATDEVHALSKYLAELCLVEYEMSHVKPSLVASACTYLSLKLLSHKRSEQMWTSTLTHYSSYTEDEVRRVAEKLCGILKKQESSKHPAIKLKYGSSKFLKISTHPVLKDVSPEVLDGGQASKRAIK